jgi:hypothetical protein
MIIKLYRDGFYKERYFDKPPPTRRHIQHTDLEERQKEDALKDTTSCMPLISHQLRLGKFLDSKMMLSRDRLECHKFEGPG